MGRLWLQPSTAAIQLLHSAARGLPGKSWENPSIVLYFPARNAFQRGGVWRDQRLHPGGIRSTLRAA